MTFRLFHPTENSGYTIYDEATFTFQLDVFADPSVAEVWISEGTMLSLIHISEPTRPY